jgi:hypothetical protein
VNRGDHVVPSACRGSVVHLVPFLFVTGGWAVVASVAAGLVSIAAAIDL